jgi:hypothetical protein
LHLDLNPARSCQRQLKLLGYELPLIRRLSYVTSLASLFCQRLASVGGKPVDHGQASRHGQVNCCSGDWLCQAYLHLRNPQHLTPDRYPFVEYPDKKHRVTGATEAATPGRVFGSEVKGATLRYLPG